MNGWWWNPAEPGRGFFVDYRGGEVRVAACHYAADGGAASQTFGPFELGPGDEVSGADFRLRFAGEGSASLDWQGVRIALEPQHRDLHANAVVTGDALGGWWVERSPRGRVLVCEQIGRRIIGALLADGAWELIEATRKQAGGYEGKWWAFEGGQALGGAHRAPRGRELSDGARIAVDAERTLRLRTADGAESAFTPVRAPAGAERLARALDVRFSTAASERVSSGLVPIAFEIHAPGFTDAAYTLALSSPQPGVPRCEIPVRLTGWTKKVTLLLNSHLLPNGRVPLVATLGRTAGDTLWTQHFSVAISNAGPVAAKVRASLERHGTPLAVLAADTADYDMDDKSLRPWFEQPDAHERIARLEREGGITREEAKALAQFVDEGYLVLPEAIEDELLAQIDRELDDVVAKKLQGYEYGTSQRIRNLHERYPGVRALWRHPRVMRTLELVFGVPARPCQTLTYVFGSQQEAHQDTVHLTPFPAGYMCGVWVALEDVRAQSGELEVFPGTHRLPRVYMNGTGCPKVTDDDWGEFGEKIVTRYQRMLKEGGFGKVTYRPKRGSVLVWHENLLHGGSVRIDQSLSRRSIVSHYFADGSIAFYDSTGLPGNMD